MTDNNIIIKIVPVNPQINHPMPSQMTNGASGYDLFACLPEPVVILPKKGELIGIGYALSLPMGYEGQIRPRRGLALKHSVSVLNSPGTIDSDYRGEIKVLLFNFGEDLFTVHNQDRVAQLVINAVPSVVFKKVDSLDETDRGVGGYVHTGR